VSVNLDFIYGLPLQTEASFAETIQKAISLQPERIVTFSYAHVPWVNPLQQKLEKTGLPTVTEKEKLFNSASAYCMKRGTGRSG
jgi:oxygen-independent coproporphyrinogen-3 oxidase